MTPQQLRQRAWKSLQTARLVADADPDVAAREAALAGEFTLKARYCSKKRHPFFPGTKAERIARGFPAKLITHDLDQLLKLTDEFGITTGALSGVDWARVTNWRGDWRYVPVGTVTTARAVEQIDATERLFRHLIHQEVIEGLWRAREALAAWRGPVNFLGMVADKATGQWNVRAAAWVWTADPDAALARVHQAVTDAMDPDVIGRLGGTELLDPDDPEIQHCFAIAGGVGPRVLYLRNNYVEGTVTPPPTYVLYLDPRPPLLLPGLGAGLLTRPIPPPP